MLVSNDKLVLAPEELKQGKYTTQQLCEQFFALFSPLITCVPAAELKKQIKQDIKLLIAVSVSKTEYSPADFIDAKKLSTARLEAAANFPNAGIDVKQTQLLGNLKCKLPEPDSRLVTFYQYVPEIYEALNTHSVFDIRQQLEKNVNDSVFNLLDRDMMNTYLTEANTGKKVGWYLCSTLLKASINIVKTNVGGALINSINNALRVHGPSIFGVNQTQVDVSEDKAVKDKVRIRCDSNWDQTATPEQVLRQLIADIGLEVIEDSQQASGNSDAVESAITAALSKAKVATLENNKGLLLLLEPIEILTYRIECIEAIIRAVILHVIELYTASGYSLSSLSHLHEMAKAVDLRLKHLKIHAYLTYLTKLAFDNIEVYDCYTIYKVCMAETLVNNGDTILRSNQSLSTQLWGQLYKNEAARAFAVPDSEQPYTQSEVKELDELLADYGSSSSWSSCYKDAMANGADKSNLKYYVNTAHRLGWLTVSDKEKYGETSSLATLISANKLYNKLNEQMQAKTQLLAVKSDYVEFTRAVGVSDFAKEVWDQISGDISRGLPWLDQKGAD